MKKYFWLVLVFCCFSIVNAQKSDSKDYSEAIKLVEVWLEAQKDYEKIPAIMAIAVEDQEVIWEGAFGQANMEKDVAAEPGTLCSICSISKLFTSVAIMKLYDEGKLRLDDEISDLLPWFDLKQQFPDSGPITIRSLLTHSSGLPREANFPYWTGPDFPFPESAAIKEELHMQETLYQSSTYFQYSNLGLTLLGDVVEEISGMSYDDYVEQNILKPLGLSNTLTELPEDLYGSKLAIGYSPLSRDLQREKINFFQAKGIKAAAGFSSNVQDLGKFASWQLRLLDTTATEILKPATLRNMHNVHWIDPDWETSWGLGFSVYKGSDGTKWISHGGSCPGYRSTLQINPQSKRAYSVMINANGTNPGKYAQGIHAILEKLGTAKDSTDTRNQQKINLQQFEGYYDTKPWSSEVYILAWKGQLVMMNLPASSPVNAMTFYKHIEGNTFRRMRDNGELGETLEFGTGKDGEVVRFKSHGNYSRKISK
jgi:CubicO group peptidase (beta-lactamase class C family)